MCLVLQLTPFTTRKIYNGKTYDPRDVSINTLVGSEFDEQKARWMDMYCRRSGLWVGTGDDKERFLPVKHVEKPLLALHIERATLLLDTISATIVVIFGKPNRLFFMKIWGQRLEEVTLWDKQQTKFYILRSEAGGINSQTNA